MKRNALLNPSGRNPRVSFWTERHRWPFDSSGYRFLAHVVHDLGKALFADEWTGEEPATDLVTELPAQLTVWVDPLELQRGSMLLREQYPPYAERNALEGCGFLGGVMPTPEEWAVAVDISTRQAQDATASYRRFTHVQNWLWARFEAGLIETAVRDFDGGKPRPLECHLWNTERIWSRFACCQMNAQAPFSDQVVHTGGQWIFVEEESLVCALRPHLPSPSPRLAQDQYLSPYLRVMIDVTRALDITPENQPKKEEVEAKIRELWPGPERLSQKDIESMATLIRDPASKAGRARQPSLQS